MEHVEGPAGLLRGSHGIL